MISDPASSKPPYFDPQEPPRPPVIYGMRGRRDVRPVISKTSSAIRDDLLQRPQHTYREEQEGNGVHPD